MSDSTKLVHRAIDLSDDGNYTDAAKLLTQAITADSNNAQAFFERGMARLNLDQVTDAVADFDRALLIAPEFPGAREWRARASESLGKHQSAAEDRLKDLRANPDGPYKGMGVSPQQWADCAQSFANDGNNLKAKEVLEEYFNKYAQQVSSYASYETAPMRLLAKLFIQSGDFVRACDFAHQAYGSKNKCPADVLVYAMALEASGDLTNARHVCAEAEKWNNQMPGLKELNERLAK